MTEPTALDLDTEEVRVLVDLGFMAVMRGHVQHAGILFKGVQVARPQEDAGYIGEALLLIQKGDIASAAALLRVRPPSDANRVFLGMALLQLGETAEAEQVLQDVVATAREPAMIEMARTLLVPADDTNRNPLPR
jgi:thioredoxin-like negative regulator of GroEL